MTAIPLHFELPESLTATKFLKKLQKKIDFEIASQQYTIKTFYDSFDWRLYSTDIICELNQSKSASHVSLLDRNTGTFLALEEQKDMPQFSDQFRKGRLKTQLSALLEMRALMPLSQLPHQAYRLNVLNKDKKTVLRIRLDEYESLPNRISLQVLKGYEKALERTSLLLQNVLQLKPTTPCSVLDHALKLQGRKAKDYSSKLSIQLEPEMHADEASIIIYRQLLRSMKINEINTIADIDSEFLHDFRVAIRRTRAGLSQIKHTLPSPIVAQYAVFFAWLGQITGLTRDMDVYLLSYKQYKEALPVSLREDITPLYEFLKQKQQQAQKELAEKLSSPTYRKQLDAWEQFLKKPLAKKDKGINAKISINKLADQRIWKVYKRIILEGKSINESSPAEALHDLRKTCKKLRYLMEFFQSLYPKEDMKSLIKALKDLQSVLGDFQDFEVQETNIKHFSEEMMAKNTPSNTFLAMGVLVQYLDSMKCKARNEFAAHFALFEQSENQTAFKHLFAHKA
ncbi:CHAD domain-containing protein [Methyloprofundus sp.]|uniref:CHAD domain-containing protein n=1 Tax=Methyloprofundus sp. TaxID=2020875 RepID=UPI003D0E955B